MGDEKIEYSPWKHTTVPMLIANAILIAFNAYNTRDYTDLTTKSMVAQEVNNDGLTDLVLKDSKGRVLETYVQFDGKYIPFKAYLEQQEQAVEKAYK